jgi:hypothetical protein
LIEEAAIESGFQLIEISVSYPPEPESRAEPWGYNVDKNNKALYKVILPPGSSVEVENIKNTSVKFQLT